MTSIRHGLGREEHIQIPYFIAASLRLDLIKPKLMRETLCFILYPFSMKSIIVALLVAFPMLVYVEVLTDVLHLHFIKLLTVLCCFIQMYQLGFTMGKKK